MSFDCNNKQWGCIKICGVYLQCIVCNIREPGLSQFPIKIIVAVSKMLKPEKWNAAFDCEGKVSGFQKILKLIRLGGVDPSIRAEVWEFLLGCYSLSSTADHRKKLRTARRERYEEVLKECQQMHASIGTGMLAFVVGSKVMDMRTYSKKGRENQPNPGTDPDPDPDPDPGPAPNHEDRLGSASGASSSRSVNDCYNNCKHNCPDRSNSSQRDSSSDSSDLVRVRNSLDSAAYDSSSLMPTPGDQYPIGLRTGAYESPYGVESFFSFPALPMTNLFGSDKCESGDGGQLTQHHELISDDDDDSMYSLKIGSSEDLTMDSNGSVYGSARPSTSFEIEMVKHGSPMLRSKTMKPEKGNLVNGVRMSDARETVPVDHASTAHGGTSGGTNKKVSEWLWTLHRIVVDVVRTDCHLEFYEDPKNLARMSDILAVYAWVDPQTGYCQGMSDLLSPFVVLFEDDADAFWCFEMLLRRTRENFRMEGQTGVMKQLLTLSHILELTDREMFTHLSNIGAASLHFAFRMLLVLFRRELSFSEALCMWEMMWAADFDESLAWKLEQYCLEALVLQLPDSAGADMGVGEENRDSDDSSKGESHGNHSVDYYVGLKSVALINHTFCGLARGFWSKNGRLPIDAIESFTSRSREDQLPVFCVAAVLILNRQKIIKETRSIDDLIKIFNDNLLKIKVRRCIRTAVKIRKKYFYKATRSLLQKNGDSLPNGSTTD